MHPNQVFVNEAGLYEVLLKSTKPLAKIFTYKLLTDIMPEIRKKGKYILKGSEKKKLDRMNKKLDNYEKELTYYYDKYNFTPSKNGYFYINEDKVIKKGKNITCYSPFVTYTFLSGTIRLDIVKIWRKECNYIKWVILIINH